MDNDITHATDERLDALEQGSGATSAEIAALEARVTALEGGGADEEAQTAEESGEETGPKRRSSRRTTEEITATDQEVINPFGEGGA